MNDFSKIKIFILILLFSPLHLFTQEKKVHGIPYIQKIHFKKYGIENKNISMIQDTNGILFIGNSNGILQFDGHYKELIETTGVPHLAKYKNKILVGSYKFFGELRYHQQNPTLIPNKKIKELTEDSIGQTKNLYCIDSTILLITKDRLYAITNKKIKALNIEPSTTFYNLRDSIIYAHKENKGVYRLKIKSLSLDKIYDHSMFPDKINKMSYIGQDSILISFQKYKGLGLIHKGHYKNLQTPGDNILAKTHITDINKLNNTIIIGTSSRGLIIFPKDKASYKHLHEDHGLFDAKINKLFVDRNQNLWVLHDGGLSRVDTQSGMLYFNHLKGISSKINHLKVFDNKLYLSTSQGVYILKNYKDAWDGPAICKKVEGLHSNSYELYNFDGNIIVSTENGIYKIENNKAHLFYNKFQRHFNTVLRYKHHPNLLLIGKDNGLSVVKYINGLFIHQGDIKGIPHPITSIAEDEKGNIWVSAKNHGIYIIDPFESYSSNIKWKNYHLDYPSTGDLKWKKLYSTSKNVYISTSQGLFLFDPLKNKLYRDPNLPKAYKNTWIFPIIEDSNQNIWFNIVSQSKNQIKNLLILNKDGELMDNLKLPVNQIKNFTINGIQPENENILWIGGTNGLIKLNLNKMNKIDIQSDILIHKVIINGDSLLISNYTSSSNKKDVPKLDYQQNNIRFEFSTTNYHSEDIISYSTHLEGYDKSWSTFKRQHYKEYRNLDEGKYVFKVKARDNLGNISNIIVYPFEITPPVYSTWYAFVIYLIFIGLLLFLIFRVRAYYFAKEKFKLENLINERTEEVLLQKEKADNLIKRLLPKETAKELKSGKKAGPYHYNMVTVLFGDIKGFTKITEKLEELNAMDLLDKLDRYFLEFDSIVEKYNIEKIKTIGDAYMCAGGIPEENHTNPVEVIVAALEMQNIMKMIKEESGEDKNIWDLRIGVDTGPVIAGVLGRSKMTYDIWGTTVNMASRMESSGEPGKINITGNTFMMVKDFFICKYRGKMPVKNKGNIDMYFVENFKPHFTDTLKGLQPNHNFKVQLQLLRLNDLEEIILEKLDKGLPEDNYYHNMKHTIDVVTQVELIGKSEKISDEDLLLVKTAALFHDVGHLISYDNHEIESVKIANSMLPGFNYSKEQLDKIGELILATKMPPKPNTHLEKILCDADLDYLGRTDFVPVAYNLYKELLAKNKIKSFEEWKEVEIDFIKNHSYFTETARKLREVNKRKQLEKIIKEMKPGIENNSKFD